MPKVALRKESVDRNVQVGHGAAVVFLVALRKESVDRNQTFPPIWTLTTQSLSARRAWIEIRDVSLNYKEVLVALRKESVDRNIMYAGTGLAKCRVALRKESVDRNFVSAFDVLAVSGRSPQGERG